MKFNDPVSKIPLVGTQKGKLMQKLNIKIVEDLLYHFPIRYEDYSKVIPIRQIEVKEGEKITVRGTVWRISNQRTKTGKLFTLAVINDETGSIQALWWNQPWITNSLRPETPVNLSGKTGWWSRKPALISPAWEIVKGNKIQDSGYKKEENGSKKRKRENLTHPETTHTGRLVPIYPTTEGISSKWLRSRIRYVITNLLGEKWLNPNPIVSQFNQIEFLPRETQEKYNFVNLTAALRQIHFPTNYKEVKSARDRLGFDEIFLLQLKSMLRRQKWSRKKTSFQLELDDVKASINNLVSSLPFRLTKAQKRSVDDILGDLSYNHPMNRLLQGDVGSGKTVVAMIGIYAAYLSGYQSALMAPTEVLANQHYQTIDNLLDPFGVKIGLHTASRKLKTQKHAPSRNKVSGSGSKVKTTTKNLKLNQNDRGHPDIDWDVVIGTHALIFEKIQFNNLGLVVIDEQHRFGVWQRAKLVRKAGQETPHVLTMTATPIPRSIALTIYGDQDMSLIDELPPGRLPVKTWVVPPSKRGAAYQWIQEQIQNAKYQMQNSQAFIIYPLIDPSESETMLDVKAATEEFEKLQKSTFPNLKLGLLHGRLKPKEKEEIVKQFRQGMLDILVSTSVIEVGIDIPTATIMVIENAERFGLASLHQLRGRVGRSGQQAYCLIFAGSQDPTVLSRLKHLEHYHNGMKLAELDLANRGPGEIFGVKQHGFWDLKIAKLTDLKLIRKTQKAAAEIFPILDKLPKLGQKVEEV